MSTCPVLDFVECAYAAQCVDFDRRLKDCTVDNFLSLGDSYRDTLEMDARNNQYRIKPVEQVVLDLNTRDYDVYEIGNWDDKSPSGATSLRRFTRGKLIVPYGFSSTASDHYHVRASEFVNDSDFARLLGKTTITEARFDEFRDAGIAIDRLYTTQPTDRYQHNRTLAEPPLRLPPMPRDRYCQKEVFGRLGRLTAMAHPDVVLHMGSTLVLINVKRAAQSRISHKKQLLCEALTIDRGVAGDAFTDYILINTAHVNKISDGKMNPRYDMMHVDKGTTRLIRQLEDEAERSFEFQRQLATDPNWFMWNYLEHDKPGMYSGIWPHLDFLRDHRDKIMRMLDPRFRRAIELAA